MLGFFFLPNSTIVFVFCSFFKNLFYFPLHSWISQWSYSFSIQSSSESLLLLIPTLMLSVSIHFSLLWQYQALNLRPCTCTLSDAASHQ
jgi:hypothetical protein